MAVRGGEGAVASVARCACIVIAALASAGCAARGVVTAPASAPAPAPAPAPKLSPDSAPNPPSTLATDLQSRAEIVRKQFGRATPMRVEGDAFLLASADHGPLFEPTADVAHRALAAYFPGLFSLHPREAVTVYVFATPGPYDAFCYRHYGAACDDPSASYRRDRREIVVNSGHAPGAVAGVIVHPLVQADFPRAPAWIENGLAALYEHPVFSPAGDIHGATDADALQALQQGLAAPDTRAQVRIDALFATPDGSFTGPGRALHEATARFACQWLDERGWLWPFYRAWRDGADADPTGEKTFQHVTGLTPAEATAQWLPWARSLRPTTVTPPAPSR